tara:strand:- start:549 stop:938 length:390 start_codon:yes stop_codon:yes gene_type:complete
MFDNLNESNYLLYAAKYYDNPHCTGLDDFLDDLKSIKYLKRLFNRFLNSGKLKDHLILNHLILLYNVFGVECATRILFLKMDESHYPILKPFLISMNYLPEVVYGINGKDINTVDIPLDELSIRVLRNV